ncbi:MAG: FtsJ-like methyltransferase family protein [Nitrososphaerales archaeon]
MKLEIAKKEYYRKLSKREGFRSRAAYKLIQIQLKHKIMKKGDKIVDLGCSPGGWVQVALKEVGGKGKVIGVDIKTLNLENLEGNFIFLKKNVYDKDLEEEILKNLQEKADVILSDLSPNISGVWELDYQKQTDMVLRVMELLPKLLRKGGRLVLKSFQGEELKNIERDLKGKFEKVFIEKPPASRKESSEVYFVCINYIGPT